MSGLAAIAALERHGLTDPGQAAAFLARHQDWEFLTTLADEPADQQTVKAPPRIIAPWWRQSGTVRAVTRWMFLAAAALAVALTAILLPPPEDVPEAVARPALRVAGTAATPPVPTFDQVHGSAVRDPFAYRPQTYTPPTAAAPVVAPVVVPEPTEPPLDTAGLGVAGLALGAKPLASLQEGGRLRQVQVGDVVRGATVAAIDLHGVTLERGSRRVVLAPRSAIRPLAQRPFQDASQGPTLRIRAPERAAPAPAPPVTARRRLDISVRDTVRASPEAPAVVLSAVARTDVDLEAGDGLVAIDDLPVASSADAMRLLADRRTAPAVVLTVRRGSTTRTVTVSWKD